MERRTKSRIDVRLTCRIEAGDARETQVRVLTENVSRNGMLMVWSGEAPVPQLDGKLTLDVILPENSDFGPRVMRCRTEVTRVLQRADDEHEIGLRVLSMRFIKPGAAPSRPLNKPKRRGKVSEPGRIPNPGDLAAMPLATERVS